MKAAIKTYSSNLERLDAEMQGLTQEWALESLGAERLLPLINIADKEYMEWLKSATKEIIDGITTDSEFTTKLLEMPYGFVRRCFLESRGKGGTL